MTLYINSSNDGIKADAVTGWLLYASFYYVLGQYNTTLKIIDHVLSRCTPNMLMLCVNNYTECINYYKQNVGCSTITLNDIMFISSKKRQLLNNHLTSHGIMIFT
jgi:hypothetical protein